MLRRSFLELPIFSFLGFKLKDKIEPEVKQEDPEIWEHEPVKLFGYDFDETSSKQIEEIVFNWLKDTKEPSIQLPITRGDSHPDWITFARSVINIKSGHNTCEQWHVATCLVFPKMISVRIKDVGINNTKLIEQGFTFPNEVRSERYDGTSYV
jgi:hypothetical protein